MTFDAPKQADSMKALLVGAENSMAVDPHTTIAANILQSVQDSMCRLNPADRAATFEAMKGVPATPLIESQALLDARWHMMMSAGLAAMQKMSGSLVSDQGTVQSATAGKAPDLKAFDVKEDGHGSVLGFTFRWHSSEPKISVAMDCQQK